mmetsp:Transcript_12867/g.23931  ORF Transcript_12867/g.23931 Transcript_12867/m.23931 type:complete len:412 (+) Transcript_12867:56-1291(+)
MGNCCGAPKKKPSIPKQISLAADNVPRQKNIEKAPPKAEEESSLFNVYSAALGEFQRALKILVQQLKPVDGEILTALLCESLEHARSELSKQLKSAKATISEHAIERWQGKLSKGLKKLEAPCCLVNDMRSFEQCSKLKRNLLYQIAAEENFSPEKAIEEFSTLAVGTYRVKCREELGEAFASSAKDLGKAKACIKNQILAERQRLICRRLECEERAKNDRNTCAIEILGLASFEEDPIQASPKPAGKVEEPAINELGCNDIEIEVVEEFTDLEFEQQKKASIKLEQNGAPPPLKQDTAHARSKSLKDDKLSASFKEPIPGLAPPPITERPAFFSNKENKSGNFRIAGSTHLSALKERINQFRQRLDQKTAADYLIENIKTRLTPKRPTPRSSFKHDEDESFVSYISSSEI